MSDVVAIGSKKYSRGFNQAERDHLTALVDDVHPMTDAIDQDVRDDAESLKKMWKSVVGECGTGTPYSCVLFNTKYCRSSKEDHWKNQEVRHRLELRSRFVPRIYLTSSF